MERKINFYAKKYFNNKFFVLEFIYTFDDNILYNLMINNYKLKIFDEISNYEKKIIDEQIKPLNLVLKNYKLINNYETFKVVKKFYYEKNNEIIENYKSIAKLNSKVFYTKIIYPQCSNCSNYDSEEKYCALYLQKIDKEKLFCTDFDEE